MGRHRQARRFPKLSLASLPYYSSSYLGPKPLECCSKVEKLFALWCFVVEGVVPLFVQGGEAVLWLFLARSPCTTAFCMEACLHQSMGWPRSAGGGSPTPRGRPPPDQASLPPPSHGGLLVGPGSLLGWYFAQMT